MTSDDVWAAVHVERQALIADLELLEPEQWDTPSLAAPWTVHDVVAHLVDCALVTPMSLLRAMVTARFDFDRQNENGMRAARGATPAETLARLRSVASRRTGPPTWLAALESRLVEEIAHGEDIRYPLGIRRDYPQPSMQAAIEYQARTSDAIGGAKTLASAVTLVSCDSDYRRGTGPELRGPTLALLMAVSGRLHVIDDLSGPGVEHLPSTNGGAAAH